MNRTTQKGKRRSVCLINTPTLFKRPLSRSMAGGLGFDSSTSMILPPLDLAMAASTLRLKGYRVGLIDADPLRLDDEAVITLLKEGGFSSVLASVSLPTLENDCLFISNLRGLVDKVVVKTLIRDEMLLNEILDRSGADFVIHGECDLNVDRIIEGETMAGAARKRAGKLVMRNSRPIKNLDDLPMPAWDLLPLETYCYPLLGAGVMTMQTSRGCPFPCAYYCPYPLVEGRVWRHQSAERIYREIDGLVKQTDIRKILFRDATFTFNRDRILALCDLIIKHSPDITWWCETRVDRLDDEMLRSMKRAGCAGMNVGVETGDEKVMQSQAKRGLTAEKLTHLKSTAESLGLKLHFLLSMGFPNETKRSFVDTYDLIRKFRPQSLGITIMTPYPGTPLYKEAKEKGWIESRDWADYGGHQFVMRTDNLSRDDLRQGLKFLQMGSGLVHDSYAGAEPRALEEKGRRIYTSLLTWAFDLGPLQNQLRQREHRDGGRGSEIVRRTKDFTMSIVIPTYNRKEQLIQCLMKLSGQDIDPSLFEVIVVDDGSTDGTGQAISLLHLSFAMRYLRQNKSGPASARNTGIRNAKNDIVTFIGDDILVTPEFVSEHLRAHTDHADETAAILGHIDWPSNMTVTPFMKFITGPKGLQFCFPDIADRQNVPCGYFYTSNISVKRSFLLREGGLFDTGFQYAAYEDTDLGRRLARLGLRIIYHPEALAYHDHHMSLKSFIRREERVGEMKVLLDQRHPELAYNQQALKSMLANAKSADEIERSGLLDTIEELEHCLRRHLRVLKENGINLEDTFIREILNPAYSFICRQARSSGLAKRMNVVCQGSEPPTHESKEMVSIIIPVFNKLKFTKQCIEAIRANTSYGPYEIIVIDNNSTDGTREFLETLTMSSGNVSVISNDENAGFARACNQGAKAAKGPYLLFLNNDTIAQKGWLGNLKKAVDRYPDVAVAGSKLLYPDNRVQHAGVVFGENKIGYHLYNGMHHDHPAVNREREFNAVTGACMLVRRDVFFEARMFDEAYTNGFEDIDLCVKIRKRGYRILYTPESVLYHFEGQTEGRYRLDPENIKLFLARWGNVIERDDHIKTAEDGFRVEYLPGSVIRIVRDADPAKVARLISEARQYQKQCNYARAFETCEEVFRLEDRNPESLKIMAEVCETMGRLGDAERYRHSLVSLEASPQNLGSLGILRKRLKKFREAAENLETAIAASSGPERYELEINLADCYTSLGQSDVALAQYEAAMEKNHKDERPYIGMGVIESQRGHIDEALKFFSAARELNPRSSRALSGIGLVEMSRGNREEAREYFQEALDKNPEDTTSLSLLIQVSYELERLEVAVEYIEKYLELHPADTDVLYKHAEICFKLKKFDMANESLQKILIFEPQRQEAIALKKVLTCDLKHQ